WHARKNNHSRWILEDLLNDRVASGLWCDAALACQRGESVDGELQFLHRQFHPARGYGCAAGSAGCRRGHGERVPPPPRCHGERLERDSRLPVRFTGGCVLRISQCLRHWNVLEGPRKPVIK